MQASEIFVFQSVPLSFRVVQEQQREIKGREREKRG